MFEKLVSHGNVKAAIRLSTEQSGSGCLPLDSIQPDGRTVKDHLLDKHPIVTPASPSAISEHPPATEPHPVVFDRIDGPMIQSTAQLMSGSAGPSGLDARAWRRLCSSFHSASLDLCTVIAKLTRSSFYVDLHGIAPLTACRLIVLDKIQELGQSESGRHLGTSSPRSFSKSHESTFRRLLGAYNCVPVRKRHVRDLRNEEAIKEEGIEVVLIVDASNALNSLNREAAFRNVHILCLALAPMLTNTYRTPSRLFIDGGYIFSWKAPHRVTLWPWQCTPLACYP